MDAGEIRDTSHFLRHETRDSAHFRTEGNQEPSFWILLTILLATGLDKSFFAAIIKI